MSQSIEDGLVERPYLLEELQNEADGIADGQGCFDQSLLRAARAAIEAQSDTITRLKEALEDAVDILLCLGFSTGEHRDAIRKARTALSSLGGDT